MNEKVYRFDAVIQKPPETGEAYVEFPFNVLREFGRDSVNVHITFDETSVQGILAKTKTPCYTIAVSREIQEQIGKFAGDTVYVTVQERE